MIEAVPKGNQLWCRLDAANYQALQTRWAKLPALRIWWNSLGVDEQKNWFQRWQRMSNAARFADLQFLCATIHASEELNDAIDRWVPFDVYHREHINDPGATHETLHRAFWEIVETRRASCQFHRGEWHIPQNGGLERRARQRLSQQWQASRGAAVTSAAQLSSLQQSSEDDLTRFTASIVAPIGMQPTLSVTGITVRPEDMPRMPVTQDLLVDAIGREVSRWITIHLEFPNLSF